MAFKKALTIKEREKMRRLRGKGLSFRKIAEFCNKCIGSVHRACASTTAVSTALETERRVGIAIRKFRKGDPHKKMIGADSLLPLLPGMTRCVVQRCLARCDFSGRKKKPYKQHPSYKFLTLEQRANHTLPRWVGSQ